MTDPAVQWVCALSLALLFACAAWHKARDRRSFVEVLAAYDLVPTRLLQLAAILLVASESLLAAALLAPGLWLFASVGVCLMLGVYAAAMAWNLRLGRIDLECGCMGGGSSTLSAALPVRNVMLMLAAVPLFSGLQTRALNPIDIGTILAATIAAVLMYLSINGLIASHIRLRGSWQRPARHSLHPTQSTSI